MATLSKTFQCIDCKEEYRSGMDVETNMYLDPEDNNTYGGHRCVYCYNKKTKFPVEPDWFIQVADRLEHEAEIEEFVNLYLSEMLPNVQYSYYTNHKYQLVLRVFESHQFSLANFVRCMEKLRKDGMCIGESTGSNGYWYTVIDFQDHTRVFTR